MDERYHVFEMKHLVDLSDRVLVPVLLYLFRRVEQRLAADRPTLIVIEEAWAALMRSLFADRIRQWLLTLRKQNAAVVLVAHSAAQVASLENRHLLVESCPTRVFLPNADALEPEAAQHYQGLGLNAAEVEIVARARRKRDYYVASPAGSRLFSLGLGPAALSFLAPGAGQGQGEAVREADRLAAEHGDGWPGELLCRRGHHDLAGDFDRLRQDGPHADESGTSEPFASDLALASS